MYENRRSFIGGSDARIIMGNDETALVRLWREHAHHHRGRLALIFVLTTVISNHEGTATLDAGCKAISPDKPTTGRLVELAMDADLAELHRFLLDRLGR